VISQALTLPVPGITVGSTIPPLSVYSYWTDALATNKLANETAVRTSGTYYIKILTPGGCYDIRPVQVVVSPLLKLVITDPDTLCVPSTLDLTASAITAGSDPGFTFEYYTDASASTPLAEPAKVALDGIYYIKAIHSVTGCFIIHPVKVIVNTQLVPIFTPIGSICINSIAPILPKKSINAITGNWSPSSILTTKEGTNTYTFIPDGGQCAGPLSIDVTITSPVTPTFAQIGPLGLNSYPLKLPTTSIEKITGTWSPSVISTTVPGKTPYIFKPDAGQCARSDTHEYYSL